MLRIAGRGFYTAAKGKEYLLEDGSKLYLIKNIISKQLPPRVHSYRPKSILSPLEIEEMKRKRAEDPATHTVLQLAREYDTFPGMVMRHCQLPREARVRLEEESLKEFNLLSLSKKKRAVDRIRRKELW